MLERERRTASERIGSFCFGALACAVALNLAGQLLAAIWPWLLGAGVVAAAITLYISRMHRW